MTPLLSLVLLATPWASMGEQQRADTMADLQSLPTLRERVAAATEGFIGTRYLLSPLGEGSGRDPDPLFRWDAVDCVTLIEQAIALSTASPTSLVEVTSSLRYQGSSTWENRLHLMEAQWLPRFVERGFLRDVTTRWGEKTRRVRKVLTAATWKEKSGAALGLPETKQPLGTFEFDIIPVELVAASLAKAPSGLVVVIVRADRPNQVSRVTHVGVLMQARGGPFLRHASRSFKKVIDEPLSRYLARNLEFAKWTVEGVALYEPVLPQK